MARRVALVVQVVVLVSACSTRPNPAVCHDGQCIDIAAPYCDIDGAIAGEPGRCIAVECTPGELAACSGESALVCSATGGGYDRIQCAAGCDPQIGCRPFCTAGEVLGCENDQLSACNTDGTGTVAQPCSLGCKSDERRCYSFEPSNGLGPSLREAASMPPITLSSGTRINTDTGVVQDVNGTAIPVSSRSISQVGASPIFVVEAGAFVVSDVTVMGTKSLAFVAHGPIEISGRISVKARAATAGPGARPFSSCTGLDSQQYDCACSTPCSIGAGGGGHAQAGGRGGGASESNGGTAVAAFSPLAGGCAGGSQISSNGMVIVARGGGGGGALQLVSATRVMLTNQGVIDVGGGGGQSTAGGGAGGTIIVETPELSISGPSAGFAANGGAGGGCAMAGMDALPNGSPAPGAICPNYFAGSGGTGTTTAGNGCIPGVNNCSALCPVVYGGGGGAVGRVHIATKDGTYGVTGNAFVSADVATAVLTRN